MKTGADLLSRRSLLLGSATAFLFSSIAHARTIKRVLPWQPYAGVPPKQVVSGPWLFFTGEEARIVETLIDQLIPPDDLGPGAKDCGCAVFLDSQLAGGYGRADGLYMRPPFAEGTASQGPQSMATPATFYRKALKALGAYVKQNNGGRSVYDLSSADVIKLLSGLESGDVKLEGVSGKTFFAQLLNNTKEGYFADPVYGGNRDMAAWKMIGFPGARYELRDWVSRHNETYPFGPVSIAGNLSANR